MHVKHPHKAFRLFQQLQQQQQQQRRKQPSKRALLSILFACSSPQALSLGQHIHAHIVREGIDSDVALATALVSMYGKCGSVEDAWKVFEKLACRNVASWNAMIAACARHGLAEEALKHFHRMQQEGVEPDMATFVNLLNSCSSPEVLELGKQVHANIVDSAVQFRVAVENALITMYSKCGSIEDARSVFNQMRQRDVVSWNVMIAAYARHGNTLETFNLFHGMQQEGLNPDRITFISILNACSSQEVLALGKQVHELIVGRGIESDVVVGTALVSMYGKCGSMEDAWRVFNKMPQRNVASWNAMISACARHGYSEDAFKYFHGMQLEGLKPDKITFISILNACTSPEALALGKQVHALIRASGTDSDVVLGTALVSMYGKCGSIEDARRVFEKMPQRNGVSWNAMIGACARLGYGGEALKLFQKMQQEGVKPDKITFISFLNACSGPEALAQAKQVHELIIDSGIESDVVVGNALVSIYGNCGSIEDARVVFNRMCQRDVVSWNSMIAACTQHGYCEQAFKLLQEMQQEGVKPDKITLVSILNACSTPDALALGKQVHALVVTSALELDAVVGTALVNMYGNCGSIKEARRLFDNMHQRDVVSWTVMTAACARHGDGDEALKLLNRMQLEGVKPNTITFISILNACSSVEALALGKQIHNFIIDSAINLDVVVENALVTMYGKCGSIIDAWRVFKKMCQRNVVSWNAIIAICSQHGYVVEAFKLFHRMLQEGMKPDKITFISIFNACCNPEALALGKQVHALIVDSELESDVVVGTALISMYGRCGSMEDAGRVFNKLRQRDVVSWNSMIAACARNGYDDEAFQIFNQMQQEGVKPDKVTFISILNAFSSPGALALGKQVHGVIVDSGIESEIIGTALISMYGNCGSIEDARKVFSNMHQRDLVTWNAIIAACARHGYGGEAVKHFDQMQQEGLTPDKITFASILSAIASLAVLTLGKQVHAHIVESRFESDVVVGTALVNMYSKCGSIEDAERIFKNMHQRSVVSWNAMISAYAQHGCGKEALQLFGQMQREGIKPDDATLTSLLSACSHAKLVDEGLQVFKSMSQEFGITPTVEHCNCIVDLLGRAGQLDQVEKFMNTMPCQPNAVTWMTLLGSCRVYGCIEQGERAAEHALQLDPQFASAYVVLSNIYAAAGRWDDVAEVRKMMLDRGIRKETGRSWIAVNNRVHEFACGDRSHPKAVDIYAELLKLTDLMKEAGYVPDTKLVLHDVEEEKKEELLCYHSEKLAIAFGHISLPSGTPLRIVKNLRVCTDCHTATKYISKLVKREIVLRDANRFHHVKDGVCSCEDYW